MDERRYARSSTFGRLAADLETLARRLGEIPLEELRPYRAAAGIAKKKGRSRWQAAQV